jgi:hypothetical protein
MDLSMEYFVVLLSASAHQQAEQFRQRHRQPLKAQQVYLNTLAVSAVEFYLQCMGLKTNWSVSQSYDPVWQAAMDVADLWICDRGRLECRPILPEATVMTIAPETWSDRCGYVAVQLEPSLQTATILGFTETTGVEIFPLEKLRSLDELLIHLQSPPTAAIHPVSTTVTSQFTQRICLSQWLQNRVEASWQTLETLLFPQPGLSLSLRTEADAATVKRAKLIDLSIQLDRQTVALLVAIVPTKPSPASTQTGIEILVQVHPTGGANFLPADLVIGLYTETGDRLQEVQSRMQDNYIQLRRFRGVPGEHFDIQLTWGEASIREKFVI